MPHNAGRFAPSGPAGSRRQTPAASSQSPGGDQTHRRPNNSSISTALSSSPKLPRGWVPAATSTAEGARAPCPPTLTPPCRPGRRSPRACAYVTTTAGRTMPERAMLAGTRLAPRNARLASAARAPNVLMEPPLPTSHRPESVGWCGFAGHGPVVKDPITAPGAVMDAITAFGGAERLCSVPPRTPSRVRLARWAILPVGSQAVGWLGSKYLITGSLARMRC